VPINIDRAEYNAVAAILYDSDGNPVASGGAVTPGAAADNATAAANTAVVVTYAATPGVSHIIDEIHLGYSAAPVGGTIQVADGATVIYGPLPVTAAGLAFLPVRKRGGAGAAMTITLSAGGSGVVGYLAIVGHRTE
jgi:hypothetical protein